MRRFLYDTSIFVYALGGEHAYREPCRSALRLAADGQLTGEASADLIQEFTHQRMRQTGSRAEAARSARDVGALCRIHDVREQDVLRGLELFEQHPRLSARDAVFAAVALGAGIDAILSTDRGFDEIPGLERIDPSDVEAVRGLLVER